MNIPLGILLLSLVLWVMFGRRLHRAIQPPPTDYAPTPDDFTRRIISNNEWGGVTVKIGNTPQYIVTTEADALAMPGVKDER